MTTRISWTMFLLSITVALSTARADERAATADPAKKYDLVYKFKPGETIRWDVDHRATIKSTVQGNSQTARTRSESVKAWKIGKAAEAGQIAFVHSVESVKMTNEISGRARVEYDSRKDAKPPAGYEDVAKAVGVPLSSIIMDQRGKLIKRKQLHLQPNDPGDTPIAIPLPSKPVSVGHVWSEPHDVKVRLKGGGTRKISTRRRFELLSVKNGVATISVDFQILTPISDPAIEGQLVQRLTKGALKFDIDAGRIISQQLDIDKRLLGVSGPASSMHYLMRFTEELTKTDPRVARKPAPPAGPALPPELKKM